eukprot:GILK01000931.1.p1 GENE.GILK01000931.1~~GILK01000931.1.p1  ORF type:complete len:387 (-),score=94.14 GILK01000931.1:794-1903(-)
MTKEVMLSERPVPAAPKPSISNFKGVMLCNRPDDGLTRKLDRSGPPPFLSAVVAKEQAGLPPTRKLRPEVKRTKKTVLHRHKQWLRELQKQKKELQATDQENQEKQEGKKKEDKKKDNKKKEDKKAKVVEGENKVDTKKKKSKKPAWALTEAENEMLEDEEATSLINFATTLDIDNYISDMEVRNALAVVKSRVDEIEREKQREQEEEDSWKQQIVDQWNQDEGQEQDGEENVTQYETTTIKRAQDDDTFSVRSEAISVSGVVRRKTRSTATASVAGGDQDYVSNQGDNPDPEKAMADRILQSSHSIRSVHSTASLRQVMAMTKSKLAAVMETVEEKPPAPLVTTISDTIRRKDVDPSQLPYLHRNPAI